MAEPLALKDQSGESQVYFERVAFCFGVLVVLSLVLVARLFFLQIIEHNRYATLSDKNRIQTQSLAPIRGLIYDRHGELLADNLPSKYLTLTTELSDDIDATLAQLQTVVGLTEDEIGAFYKRLKRKQRPFEPIALRFRLTEQEIARVEVNRYRLRGVRVEARLVRHYPGKALVAHAVGSVRRINEDDLSRIDAVAYSGTDHIGRTGVERHYEQLLLGAVGHQRVETNARGRVMNILDQTKPEPGRNLVLHLDAGLQRAASDALGDRRGVVVALEPRSGGILALVSKPTYDPNLFVAGIDVRTYGTLRDNVDAPLFNRAVQGQYEPGSTIKPFMGLAGLATGVTTPEFSIRDPGYFRLPGSRRLYRDWNWKKDGRGGHGEHVDLERALFRSCNVYFYSLAVDMGIDTIHAQLDNFGFGRSTVLDLKEARSGLLPSREWKEGVRGEPWYPGDTVNIGIGQGDMLVTPLQLAAAYATLANRGAAVAPRMLLDGVEASARTPDVSRLKTIASEHWDLVIGAMEQVIHRGNMGFGENGTAWAYIGQDIPYRMAGKSGTAQVVGIKQGEEYEEEELAERQRKHAWFAGFAPVENPAIVIVVLVENGGGGSSVAAPVVREVADYYLLSKPARVARR